MNGRYSWEGIPAANNTTVLIPFWTHGNREWLEQTKQSFPVGTPILVVENDGEFSQAMNAGLDQITTDYVFFMGADDKVLPDTLDFLESAAWDVDVAYPSRLFYGPEMGTPTAATRAVPFCPNRLLMWNYIPGVSLARVSSVKKVGGFRHLPFQTHEDWDLWVRMMRAGARFKAVPEAQIRVRQHPNSKSSKVRDKHAPELLKEIYEGIVGEPPSNLQASFYYQNSLPTTYLRCLLPAKYLPAACYWDHPAMIDKEEGMEFPQHRGVAVWQFPGDVAKGLLIERMRQLRIPVLVEVDDNYIGGRDGFKTSWVETIADMSRDEPHSFEAHKRITRDLADGVIVTTETLAKTYRKINPHVYVCPNQVEPSDWQDPAEARRQVRDMIGVDQDAFVVGWFGSDYHVIDSPLVRRALEWAARQDGVEVVIMGCGGVGLNHQKEVLRGWEFPRRHIGWSNDLSVYHRSLSALDVGVAPIIGSPWAQNKSDVKALEYAMAGALPIVSDQPPYSTLTHNENCLKARDARAFYEQVRWAVQHQDEAKDLAARSREYVLRERTAAGNVWRYHEAFEDVKRRVGTD